MISEAESPEKVSKNEKIKVASQYLRGTILEGLADTTTGSISSDDTQLTKFHGIYQQDDRDVRKERRRQKLEKAFSFMIRVRVPGGVCTPEQWLAMDRLADSHANGTLKLTTRQAFQFHGVLKGKLKETIQEINRSLLDTIAACGDVNRNVMCNPNLEESSVHAAVNALANEISKELTPKTNAYHEIWLDGAKVAGAEEEEPLYGKTYLPRKFKIGIAVPPHNDVDVFSQDLGFIAIVENGKLLGYNVTAGGGMGTDHGKSNLTYPRLGDVLGFVSPEDVLKVTTAIVTVQRDFGNRSNRKHARLKYTIDDRGLDWFKALVQERSGVSFQPAREYSFTTTSDRYGWHQWDNGKWCLNLFILSGRLFDSDECKTRTCLREIAKTHKGDFRLTPNQNLIIGNIDEADKGAIEAILAKYNLQNSHEQSGLRLNAISCVALPTCGLAMAESERYLPTILDRLEKTMEAEGLHKDAISIRITGCPNGCGRPYLGEIGLVGRAPGAFNLYLGAKLNGTRLNKLYKKLETEEEIFEELEPIIKRYATERTQGEEFGDFAIRVGLVKETTAGLNFHD